MRSAPPHACRKCQHTKNTHNLRTSCIWELRWTFKITKLTWKRRYRLKKQVDLHMWSACNRPYLPTVLTSSNSFLCRELEEQMLWFHEGLAEQTLENSIQGKQRRHQTENSTPFSIMKVQTTWSTWSVWGHLERPWIGYKAYYMLDWHDVSINRSRKGAFKLVHTIENFTWYWFGSHETVNIFPSFHT